MRVLLTLLLLTPMTLAQRFLRDGFSSQMDTEFRGAMKLDEGESQSGMSREMYLMKDLEWQLQPPKLEGSQLSGSVQSHVEKYLNGPLRLQLLQKQGRFGLRAVASMESGKKLRAFWRQGIAERTKSSDFLEMSYDEAIQARLFMAEFEVQLPPMKGTRQLPSVVFQIPLEPGSMNKKSMVPRSAGHVKVYPQGRKQGEKREPVYAGTCNASICMKNGLVDPNWARGRSPFKKGRVTGLL